MAAELYLSEYNLMVLFTMIDLNAVATNLELHPDGIWYARQATPIEYPEEGNAFCYSVEEGSFWFNHRNTFILEALRRYPPGGAFFDVGGGNGFVALAIREAGIETVLVEPGIEGILNAHRRGLDQLICATLETAGFLPHSLPAVGMFDVLEHIADDLAFLEKIHEVVIPEGRLYLTVPAYSFLWSIEDDFAQHFRRYTLPQLKQLLNQAGFSTEYSTYIFATLPAPIYFFRTIPSKLGWRKKGDLHHIESELKPRSTTANGLLDSTLRLELKALERLKSLPFGGSCLLVAKNS
jgi:SAM-dependent methyltransferase